MTIEFRCAKVRQEVEKSILSRYRIFLPRISLLSPRNLEEARLFSPVTFVTESVGS